MNNNHISSALDDYLENLKFEIEHPNEIRGLPTGIKMLDQVIDGVKPGKIVLVGGRPAMGKTSLAINIAYNLSNYFYDNDNNKCVLYFNLEMSNQIIARRFVAKESGLTYSQFHKEARDPLIQENIKKSILALKQLPIYISNRGYDLDEIKEEIGKISTQKQIGCIIIDYLQLIGKTKLTEDYTQILSELKGLAMELKVPFIILTQLKRSLENRSNKRPLSCDIRGYDKKQNSVDKIIFLYREMYYLKMQPEPKKRKNENMKSFMLRLNEWDKKKKEVENQCDIIITKNTPKSSAVLRVFFNENNGIFSDRYKEIPL